MRTGKWAVSTLYCVAGKWNVRHDSRGQLAWRRHGEAIEIVYWLSDLGVRRVPAGGVVFTISERRSIGVAWDGGAAKSGPPPEVSKDDLKVGLLRLSGHDQRNPRWLSGLYHRLLGMKLITHIKNWVTVTFPLTRQILNPEVCPETQSVHVARKQTSIKVRDLDNGKREDEAGSHHSWDVAGDW